MKFCEECGYRICNIPNDEWWNHIINHKEGEKQMNEFDAERLGKIAMILTKYDTKIPFECMVELSKLIPVRSTKQEKKELEK